MDDILKDKDKLDLKIEALVQEFIQEHKVSYVGDIRGLVVRQQYNDGPNIIISVNANVDSFIKIT